MFCFDQRYFQHLVEISPDIVIAIERDGTIDYFNDSARQSLRYAPSEIIGHKVTELYPSLEEARRVMKAMRESSDRGRIANFETVFKSKDGAQIPVAISGSLIYDDEGKEIGSIGFARDIRGLRHREQLATLGEIAVSLAHEINNPLESITNNLELLARSIRSRLTDTELVVENAHLDSISNGLERVMGIVRRLDEMARSGVYETRDYLQGKRMADLAPRQGQHEPRALADNGAPADWPLAGMRVLLVDDDTSVLLSLAELLTAERCVVHTADRPSKALGILRNMKIDAVVSDVVMPEMDGYEFYTAVKEEWPQMPVIMMTAYYYDKDHIMKRSRLKGLKAAIFKKPVNPAQLRKVLIAARPQPVAARPTPLLT